MARGRRAYSDAELEALPARQRQKILAKRRRRQRPEVRAAENEQAKRWYRTRAERAPEKYGRNHRLRSIYGVSSDSMESLLASQHHQCACCGEPEPKHVLGWSIDHDHATGKIRGIICQDCNRTLGMLGDNLEAALVFTEMYLDYLRRDPPNLVYTHPVRVRPSTKKRQMKALERRARITETRGPHPGVCASSPG